MSRTDKDLPWRVVYPNGFETYYEVCKSPLSGDSNFRKGRKILKRQRSKAIRRYQPEARQNGAKAPYSGLKSTWDFA